MKIVPVSTLHSFSQLDIFLSGQFQELFSSPIKQYLLQEGGKHVWYDGIILVGEGRFKASIITYPNNKNQNCRFK